MIQKFFRAGGFLLLFLLAKNGNATGFTVLGGYGISGGSVTPTTGFTVASHNPAFGGGGLFDFPMFPAVGIELGALYMLRGFNEVPSKGPYTAVTLTTLQFPLLLRVYLLPSVSAGLGGYYSSALGSTGAYSGTDYGLVTSLGLKVKMAPFLQFVVDLRYLFGATDIDVSSATATYLTDLQAFVGIRFGK